MSDFFDSEIVKEELQEIRDLQNDIYGKIMKLHIFHVKLWNFCGLFAI